MALYDVQIHKKTGWPGGIVKAGSVRWRAGDNANFEVVTLELTREQVDDIRHVRLRVHPDGRVEAVPRKDWPDEKVRVQALEQFVRAEVEGVSGAEYKRRADAMAESARGER